MENEETKVRFKEKMDLMDKKNKCTFMNFHLFMNFRTIAHKCALVYQFHISSQIYFLICDLVYLKNHEYRKLKREKLCFLWRFPVWNFGSLNYFVLTK